MRRVPSGACKGCPAYPVSAVEACYISLGGSVGSCGGFTIYPLDFSYSDVIHDLYTDSVQNGWEDWSWDCTRNFSSTSPVYSGTYAIRVSYTANLWGGLYFGNNTPVRTVGKTNVLAKVRAETAGTLLSRARKGRRGRQARGAPRELLRWQSPRQHMGKLPIPLSVLQASNVSNLTGIQFKKRETPARVVHFDQVALQ